MLSTHLLVMFKNATRGGRWLAVALAIGLSFSSRGFGAKPVPYTLVTLDSRAGSVRSLVSDVNVVGATITCVGYLAEADGNKAVLWKVTPAEAGFDVTTCYLTGGEFSAALNTSGEAVGQRSTFDTPTKLWLLRGLYWQNPDGFPLTLAPLTGDNETQPLGINADGVIVGRSTYKHATYDENGNVKNTFQEPTAVAWRTDQGDANGELVPFVLDGQPEFSAAHDINECGAEGFAQVVGIVVEGRPVFWQVDCGSMESTGPLLLVPGDVAAGGAAEAVSDAGDICGKYDMLAFRRFAGGAFEQLSAPRGATSVANDINDQRQVVGRVWEWNRTGGLSETYGVLWQADGKRVELNSFLRRSDWRYIHEGQAIHSAGIIAATGSLNADGEMRALLMIPQ